MAPDKMTSILRRFRPFLQMIILICGFLLSSCVTEGQPVNKGVTVGEKLPTFSVTLNDGSEITTASLRGKKVLIEFFNTSCPDCRESLPLINQLYESMKDREDVAIFAIARDEGESTIALFWEENNLMLPFSPQPDRKVYELFATVGIPRIFIADREGIITSIFGPDDHPTISQLTTLLSP